MTTARLIVATLVSLALIGCVVATTRDSATEPSSSPSAPPANSPGVSSSVAPTTSTGGTGTGGRPLNVLENQTIDALGRIGLPAGPNEHGFTNAFLWAGSPDASELLVSAVHIEDDGSDFVARGQRTIAGVPVENGVFGGSGADIADRFVCRGVNYYIRGTPPTYFADVDAFIAAFVAVLGCSD